MFAIGFLSLLSMGFVAMAMGGDDDVAEADQNEDGQDEMIHSSVNNEQDYDSTTRNDLIRGYVPTEEVDEETNARITAFLDALDPGQPINEAAGEFRSFVNELGVEIIDITETAIESDEDVQDAPDQDDDDGDEDEQNYDTATRDDLIRGYVRFEDVDDETDARITAFLDALDPSQPINEAAAEFRAFVTGLGVEVIGTQAAGEETEGGLIRPPMGDEYRDPWTIAEEAEEARQPVNLVTVSDITGEEVPDDLVLTERAVTADPDEQAFDVIAPNGANSISVTYDEEHTFNIIFNESTISVTAALNSNIDAPQGRLVSDTNLSTDEDGNTIEEFLYTRVHDTSTDIEIDVSTEQLGVHVSQIELTNPDNTLDFNFADDVNGNFHLFFHEIEEENDEGGTSTSKRAFIVQTSSTQTSLSAAEVAQIAEEGLARTQTTNVVAEIFLGTDSLHYGDAEQTQVIISNYMNDTARITANIRWASVSEHAELLPEPVEAGGGGDDPTATPGGDDFVGVDDPFEGISLNPFSYFQP